jgi:hypothetical protein
MAYDATKVGDPTNVTIAIAPKAGGTAFTGVWEKYEIPGEKVSEIDVTGVNTAGSDRIYVASVMGDTDTISGSLYWNPSTVVKIPSKGVMQTVTLTLPAAFGSLTIIFDAFVVERSKIPLVVGTAMMCDVTFRRSGGITGTAASAGLI